MEDREIFKETEKPIVLIVDDVPANLQYLGSILKKENYKITVASNGKQALKIIEEITPDLILLDIVMPDLSGYEVCEKLKSRDDTRDIPIIFLTSKNETEDIVTGFKVGAVDYVTKPFNAVELSARVRTHMELKKSRDLEKKLNIELNEKNKDLEQIIHIISHDIRSPMQNIQGLSELIDISLGEVINRFDKEKDIETLRSKVNGILAHSIPDHLVNIQKCIEKSNRLLTSLLRITRMGRDSLKFRELDMNKLLYEILYTYEYTIKENDIKIVIGDLPECIGDEVHITQVFSNLIGNAIKYRHPERQVIIKISGKKEKKEATFIIEDNGIGIKKEDHEKIFLIFQRLNPNKTKGEGLGLTIVSKILSLHHGSIRVESEENNGSKFFITLPAT